MKAFSENLALWVSALGTFLSLLGALQSVPWLVWLGGLLVLIAISAALYAWRQQTRLESIALKVAGRSIDSLNMATLRRKRNKSLVVQEADNTAVIDGQDLKLAWECTGYCRDGDESSMEFSIDADNNTPFGALECYAYDLRRDPARRHRIRPILIGPDGISKKIAVPFLAPLRSGDAFHLLLICHLPGCMKAGTDYYTASLSFAQNEPLRYKLDLRFVGDRPDWVRLYEVTSGRAKLVKDLKPHDANQDRVKYRDAIENAAANSVRIYMFERTAGAGEHHKEIASSEIMSSR